MKMQDMYIIRFAGTITQGPNAGKAYSYPSSWGGVFFDTEAEARKKLALYREREPQLSFKLLHCTFTKTRQIETELSIDG